MSVVLGVCGGLGGGLGAICSLGEEVVRACGGNVGNSNLQVRGF